MIDKKAENIDWEENDPSASGYIKNRPFYTDDNGKVKKIDEKYIKFPDGALIGEKGEGEYSEVFNDYRNNHAYGDYSHVEGLETTAWGIAAHAEGYETYVDADYAHAEGYETHAEGQASHAEGHNTKAEGFNSHAEGYGTTASGGESHAEGNGTVASEGCAHAEGSGTTASGYGSHAEGNGTIAKGHYSHVQGKYNIVDEEDKYAHIVGNGESISHGSWFEENRSNAHTLDWEGNAWFAGEMEGKALILSSSTPDSTKRFKLTIDDDGVMTATEIVEQEA